MKFSLITLTIISLIAKLVIAIGMGLFTCAWGLDASECSDTVSLMIKIFSYLPELIVFFGFTGLSFVKSYNHKLIMVFAGYIILVLPWLYFLNK